ncbi:MAG: alpha/beta hydrolase [Pseudomonadota bacterium]
MPLPLVMVHGFMGGSQQWKLQAQQFSQSQNIIAPDLPGFASNAHQTAPDTIEGFARFVFKELDKQNVDRITLLGHSMGGMIVQEMVALEPHRIDRLILYGTASSGDLPERFETFETSKKRIQNDGVSASARRISATWFLDQHRAKQYETCAAIAEQSSKQATMAGLDAMKSWSRTANLQSIECPTLIIWGEFDRTYHWPQIEKLWKAIPEVSLAVLPGCSHAAHLEKPNLFNAVLSDFLV